MVFLLHDKLGWRWQSTGKGQTVEFEIVGIFSGKNKRNSQVYLSDFSENQNLQTMKVA